MAYKWRKKLKIQILKLFCENLSDKELEVFVCVEVLRPSQPNGVMSSVVDLPNHMFTG